MPERVLTKFSDNEDEAPKKTVTAPPEQKALTSTSTESTEKKAKKRKRDSKKGAKSQQEESAPVPTQSSKQTSISTSTPSKTSSTPSESRDDMAAATTNGASNNHHHQQQRLQARPPHKTVFFRDTEGTTANTASSAPTLKAKAAKLLETRKKLPIWSHSESIKSSLKNQDVMLLVGETGSGKSTQIPQFLINESWCQRRKVRIPETKDEVEVGGCIAITQPRRVAAITLARRVAEEVGTPLGSSSPASTVGYSVRFDNCTSPSTRIKFLTEGMLLQEMLRDPYLRQYSAVVVDEVHERGVNVDLVMGFMRNLVIGKMARERGVPMKVVVMSATADMEGIMKFFRGSSPSPQKAIGMPGVTDEEEDTSMTEEQIAVCHIKGRQYPVKTIYLEQPTSDYIDAALKTIFSIHYKEPLPGDVLVFLTGQETVEALEYLVNEYAANMDRSIPKILALPLFAALPQLAQQRVFQPAPPRTRKIILATNIAETSVTVTGVRYVVDCGKAKMKHFRTQLGLDSLLVKPISKSAAIQRKGRAGREAAGHCYRLYTEKDYNSLAETNTPEILRCDLSQALLTMKARGVERITDFPFLTSPSREALEKALLQLYQLEALDDNGKITEMGFQLAKLPITAPLGRVLLDAASNAEDTSTLEAVIDIISCLSVENIFLAVNSEEKKEAADEARKDLYRREGDHMTMLATVRAYAAENADRKAWCEKRFISHRGMQSVMDVRKQLTLQCRTAKLLPKASSTSTAPDSTPISDTLTTSILKSFLKGFLFKTAIRLPDNSYRTLAGSQTVAIHPASVLFQKKVEAIMYNEFVFTNKSYARGVSSVKMEWINEVLGGGSS